MNDTHNHKLIYLNDNKRKGESNLIFTHFDGNLFKHE
jgi:hypothetical protein